MPLNSREQAKDQRAVLREVAAILKKKPTPMRLFGDGFVSEGMMVKGFNPPSEDWLDDLHTTVRGDGAKTPTIYVEPRNANQPNATGSDAFDVYLTSLDRDGKEVSWNCGVVFAEEL